MLNRAEEDAFFRSILLGAGIGLAYWPSFWGAATSPRWAFIATIPALVTLSIPQRIKLNAPLIWGLAWFVWTLLTLSWSLNPTDGVGLALQLLFLAVVTMAGYLCPLEAMLIGASLALIVSDGLLVAELSGHRLNIPDATYRSGLWINRDFLGEFAALIGVGLICLRRYWWSLISFFPIIITEARGASLAVIATLAFRFRKTIGLYGIAALVALGVGAVFWMKGGVDASIKIERIQVWQDILPHITLFGTGAGSFYTLYPLMAEAMDTFIKRPEHAHNDFIEMAFEIGLVGLALFGAMFVSVFKRALQHDAASLILMAFLVEGLFGMPLHNPGTAFVAAFCLGAVARARADLLKPAVPGGVLVQQRQMG